MGQKRRKSSQIIGKVSEADLLEKGGVSDLLPPRKGTDREDIGLAKTRTIRITGVQSGRRRKPVPSGGSGSSSSALVPARVPCSVTGTRETEQPWP